MLKSPHRPILSQTAHHRIHIAGNHHQLPQLVWVTLLGPGRLLRLRRPLRPSATGMDTVIRVQGVWSAMQAAPVVVLVLLGWVDSFPDPGSAPTRTDRARFSRIRQTIWIRCLNHSRLHVVSQHPCGVIFVVPYRRSSRLLRPNFCLYNPLFAEFGHRTHESESSNKPIQIFRNTCWFYCILSTFDYSVCEVCT